MLMAGAGGIIFAVHLHRKHSASRALLKQIDDQDYHWNEAVLDERVEKTYYAVQRAWSDMDLDALISARVCMAAGRSSLLSWR